MVSNLHLQICNKLKDQKIFNKRIEKRLHEINDIKQVKSFYRKLIKSKKEILKFHQAFFALDLSIDIISHLLNIDLYEKNNIYILLQKKLKIDEHRILLLLKLAATNIPKSVLIALKKSNGNNEFDKVFCLIPPIFLFRNKIMKPTDFPIRVEKSIKSLSTPMRN
jgi:hypothetical protein